MHNSLLVSEGSIDYDFNYLHNGAHNLILHHERSQPLQPFFTFGMGSNGTSTSNGGNSDVATTDELRRELYVALSRCSTAFLYDIQASRESEGIDSRLITRRGFRVSTAGSSVYHPQNDEQDPDPEEITHPGEDDNTNMSPMFSMQNMQVTTSTNGVSLTNTSMRNMQVITGADRVSRNVMKVS